jgi:hypothetical protein
MPERHPKTGRWFTASPDESKERGKTETSEKTRQFLALALSRWKLISEAEARTRQDALDDLEFSVGNQWPEDIRTQRTTEGKPCITMNRLPQTIRYVTNEQRQQRPAAQINPVGNGASKERADIRQGIIRHIEVNSEADIADDTAFDAMVRCGFGWQRVVTDYVDDESDDQELFIRWIKNGFTVYADPTTMMPDKSDMDYAFIVEDMSVEEFKHEYPDSALASIRDWTSLGDAPPEWANSEKQTIRVAEYFYVEKEGRKRKVKWAKISAIDILEGNKDKTEGSYWPGENASRYIPLVKVVADDLDVNGRTHQSGLVRHMKEPMKMYNVMISAMTQAAMLAPNAPFIMVEGQDEGHEEMWRLANRRMDSRLVYKNVSLNGAPAPAPVRNNTEPPIQAFGAILHQCELDLQACAGVYNPALGKQEHSDQSGVAITRLQRQSDLATLNFSDNLARSIRYRTRILLDNIPKVYDTPRVMRILNPDGTSRHVVTHVGDEQAGAANEMLTEDIQQVFDLGVGTYDCTVSVGPNVQTRRQEAVETQLNLLKMLPPQVAQTLLDLMVRNMDIPQADEMADRLKLQLPPQLQQLDSGGDTKSQLQQTQAQLAQASQQVQMLSDVNSQLLKTITQKTIEQKGKLDLEHLKILGQLVVAEVNTKSQDANERRQMLLDLLGQLGESAGNMQETAQQQAHEVGMAAMQHNQAMQQQAAAAAQQQQQQGAQQAHERQQQSADQSHETNMAFTNAALTPQPQANQ